MEEYRGTLPVNESVPEEEILPGEKTVSEAEVPAEDTKPETADSSPDEKTDAPNAESNAPEAPETPAAVPHVRPRRPKQVKKRWPPILALVVFLLLVAGAVVWLVLRGTPAEDIALGSAEIKLTRGESCRLTYQLTPADSDDEITWQLSDETVASIDAYGKVTALAEGNCVITVLTESGCKASCYLIVEPPLTEEEAAAVGNRELYAATLDGQVQYFYGKNYSLSLYSNSSGHIYCPDGSYRFTWDYSGTEGVYYCFTATFSDKATAEIYYNADSSGSMYDTVAFRFESGNIWVFH